MRTVWLLSKECRKSAAWCFGIKDDKNRRDHPAMAEDAEDGGDAHGNASSLAAVRRGQAIRAVIACLTTLLLFSPLYFPLIVESFSPAARPASPAPGADLAHFLRGAIGLRRFIAGPVKASAPWGLQWASNLVSTPTPARPGRTEAGTPRLYINGKPLVSGRGVKIYVYREFEVLNPCLSPSLWEPPGFKHNWDANKWVCGNFGALASKIARLIMDSPAYTSNPAEADYFLIPLDTFALDMLPRPADTIPPCTAKRTEACMSDPDPWWYFSKPGTPPSGQTAPPLSPEAVAVWKKLQRAASNRVSLAFNYTLTQLETKHALWRSRRADHLLVFGTAEGWFRGRLWHKFFDRLEGVSRITVEGTAFNKHYNIVDQTDVVFDAPWPMYTRRTENDIVVPGWVNNPLFTDSNMQSFQPSWRGAPLGLDVYWSGNVWGVQCECHDLRSALVAAFKDAGRNELIQGQGVNMETSNSTLFWMADRGQVQYWAAMKSAEFCLLPRGWGLWTLRFFESALAGCLPVLLSDGAELPFEGPGAALEGAYDRFVIRVPERDVGRIRAILYAIPDDERKARRQAMMETVHALSYNEIPLEGDAFDLLLQELARRKRPGSTPAKGALGWLSGLATGRVVNPGPPPPSGGPAAVAAATVEPTAVTGVPETQPDPVGGDPAPWDGVPGTEMGQGLRHGLGHGLGQGLDHGLPESSAPAPAAAATVRRSPVPQFPAAAAWKTQESMGGT